MQSPHYPADNQFTKYGQQVLSNVSPQDYLADSYNFVHSLNQNKLPMNIQALDKDNYQRSTNALHDPNQIQNILYQTDFQNVKNNQPNPYNNYMQNVKKQDELLKKMQNFHGGIISKEMALKKQQEDLINLNHLNRYNNDMAQVANQSQRKAVLNYKNGNKDENDPFLNFLKDQTMFPPTNQDIPIQNKIEDLNILNQLSQPLVSPNGPIRGPINSPINIQNNDIGSPLNLPIPNEINDLSQMHHFHNRSASTVSPKIPIINALSARKSSVISPHIKSLSHISPLHNPSVLNQQLQQPYQTPPNYSQPVVHVIPMPYPPQSDKRSNHSSREKSNKIPEEVRSMLTKQNEMLQNFIEKFEKNTSLEPNDNYSEKYEMKIKELEKNFDLTQEILNLKKQMYSFNAEKNNTANEEKKNILPPPSMFNAMSPFQNFSNPYNNGMNTMGMNPMGMNPMGMNPMGMNPMGMNPMGMNQMNGWNPYQNFNPNSQQNPWMNGGMQNPGNTNFNRTSPFRTGQRNNKSNIEQLLIKLLGEGDHHRGSPHKNLQTKFEKMNNSFEIHKEKIPQKKKTTVLDKTSKLSSLNSTDHIKRKSFESQSDESKSINHDSNQSITVVPIKKNTASSSKKKKMLSKYVRKWFRYVSFPFIWKKSIDEKILQRKIKFMQTFEEKISEIIEKANDWALKSSRGLSPLIDKTKAKNYDLVHIKNIFEKNNRKEAGLIFQGLKSIIQLIINDLLENTNEKVLDKVVIQFLGEICKDRAFLPDHFIFPFEFSRLNFSKFYGFLNNPDISQHKMIITFFLIIKIYIGNIFINPWRIKPKYPTHLFFPNNLKSACSIIVNIIIEHFDKKLVSSNYDESLMKPKFKIHLLNKIITRNDGFYYNVNKERSSQAAAIDISENIFIEGLYSVTEYQWIIDKELKWFGILKDQISNWIDKSYNLINQNTDK